MTAFNIKKRVVQLTLLALTTAATGAAAEPAPVRGELKGFYGQGEACIIAPHETGGVFITASARSALTDAMESLGAVAGELDALEAVTDDDALAPVLSPKLSGAELPLIDPLASLPRELDAALTDRDAYRWVDHGIRKEATFDVPVVMNERVQRYLTMYQTGHKGYFSKWLEKSGAYLPHLKRILREKGLPEDLAYLALIESGFNPYLISRARAVGVWQFMSETARLYGLRVDWWVDERRDMEKASHAAADFLGDLYERFDSWYLAGAAYNAGPGKVSSAIRRHNSRDFWVLAKKRRPLVRETKDYIPKYLAAMMIAKDPEKYGFFDLKYHDPISYEKVMVDRPTDIKVIARAAGTTTKDIKRLNPELRRWFTPPTKGGYEVKIPAGSSENFHANMADVPRGERLKFHRHKVKYGETLSGLAQRYGTALKPIMYLNDIKNPRRVRAGRSIVIPVPEGTKIAKASGKKRAKRRPQPPGTVPYTVKSGDTLWDLSVKFGVDVKSLKKTNGIGRRSLIRPGETLYIKTAKL